MESTVIWIYNQDFLALRKDKATLPDTQGQRQGVV